MCQLIRWGIVFLLLIPCAITDIKKRQVNIIWIGICAMVGIILWVVEARFGFHVLLYSLIGVILMGISKLSRGGIGMGDCYLMISIGLIVGWQYTLLILFYALIGTSIIGVIGLIKKKTKEIPFVPYVLIASVIVCFLYQ